jgi:hypothetical protein
MKPRIDLDFVVLVAVLFGLFLAIFWGASEIIPVLIALIGELLQ